MILKQMRHFEKYTIKNSATVREALIALNNLSNDTLNLFVINDAFFVEGSLTDGDIRRHLIKGITLDDNITLVMNRDFHYLEEGNIDVSMIRKLKAIPINLLPILDKNRKLINIYNLKTHQSFLPIDAILMAGGKGERLRPLTEKIPKPLLKVGDKAIIDYNIERLLSYGVRNISVTVNYLKEQIEKHFEQERNGIKISCIREPAFWGTMGAVKLVNRIYNDTCLVMNSDLFTNINYEDFFLHFKEHNADMSVAVVPYSITVPYGIFDLEGRNIKGIKEKPTYNYYANAGIYLIKRNLLDLIPEETFFDATDLIKLLIDKEYNVIRFPLTGYWIDIGKHEDYKKAEDIVKHL